ncbi:polar amino acid transport system substrate-binding protein [Enterococcus sp. PF1-24]|uniref:amino acid ABC transporter substrate-binding protein n=1 Tax=unclassified Enterococcus TaxID=2608891 RepID=UPI00247514B0|nr:MULTISPECIES: amino acid ABC transporter substrate-binding protein [unclassified Enterococcus]MDH6363729.1 polar amino acid transport system substrate-binding protein [Enterococcus sp. PFB1-1]MDH6400685.1 polar amino acid transport system substrate-binding protein [Enterococcus sp. PF1-24]
MKKIMMSLLCVAGIGILGACGGNKEAADTADNSWKTVEENGKVVVGLDDTFVPMGFRDEAGEIVGFDVDLATAVFAEYDIDVEFQPIDWSMKEAELDNGTIDLIWNGYTVTESRQKKVLFSDAYKQNEQVLVTKKESGIERFADMEGKILGAQTGSSGYEAFLDQPELLADIVADNDAILFSSFNEAFIDLKSGRIDGLLIDRVYAGYYLAQSGELANYTINAGEFENEDFAVGARKDDKALVGKINESIATLKENSEFDKISEKWFGE